MTRLTFPDEGSRLVYTVGNSLLGEASGSTALVYADDAATTLADIQTTGGAAISGSALTVEAYSLLPLFFGPDGADTVWVKVAGGPTTPVYARADDRIDAVKATADSAAQKSANLADLASAAGARTSLGLGSAATMTPAGIAADSAFTTTYGPLVVGDVVLVNGATAAAAQAAIDASSPGDTILFTRRAYSWSSTVVLKPSRRYVGQHISNGGIGSPLASVAGAPVIRQADGADLDALMVGEAYASTGASIAMDAPITVENLFLDGNKAGQTAGAGHGIVWAGFRGRFRDLTMTQTRGSGLVLTDRNVGGNNLTGRGFENHIERVSIDAPGQHGIWVRNFAAFLSDGFVKDCVVGFSGVDGIKIETAIGWEIAGCHIYATGFNHIVTHGAAATRVHDNYMESFGRVTGTGSIAWSGATTYVRYAPVLHSGVAYYSLADGNLNNTPTPGSVFWQSMPVGAYVGLLLFDCGGTRPSFVHGNVVANNSINQAGFVYRAFNLHVDNSNVATVLLHDNCVSQEAGSGTSVYTAYRLNRATGTLRVLGRNNKIIGTVGTSWNIDATVDLNGPVAVVTAGAQTQTIASTSPTDTAGAVSATAVASPAAGAVAVVTFGVGMGRTPHVVITSTSSAAAAAGLYVSAKSATAFTVSSSVAAGSGAVLTFDYVVAGQA